VERAQRFFEICLTLWAIGPGPMGPQKRGPQGPGPIFARSMEIGAPPMRHLSFLGETQEGVLPCGRVPLRRAPLRRAPLRRAPCGVLLAGVLILRPLRNAPRAAATMPRIRWARMRQGGLQRNRRFKIDHFRELRNCDDVTYSAQGTSQCNPGMLVRRA